MILLYYKLFINIYTFYAHSFYSYKYFLVPYGNNEIESVVVFLSDHKKS